jgi:hypothetical protein
MAESFLEEQLKRIRGMTEQMTRARNEAAELTDEFARSRKSGRQDPLHDVKDLRKYSYPDRETDRPVEHAGKARRHLAHDSSRRRR